MYITQEADYAIRIVHCLAKNGIRRDARSISEEVAVTLRFSLKILGKLSGAGIVNSFKGNRGGYELAGGAADFSLLDVLTAVDGPYFISRCIPGGECNQGIQGCCAAQKVFGQISADVNKRLAAVTFADLLQDEQSMQKVSVAGQ